MRAPAHDTAGWGTVTNKGNKEKSDVSSSLLATNEFDDNKGAETNVREQNGEQKLFEKQKSEKTCMEYPKQQLK